MFCGVEDIEFDHVLLVLVLLWVIPDSDPSLSRWDRVSLIVSTRMGERLPVLRIGAPGSIAAPLVLVVGLPVRGPMRFVRLHLRRFLIGLSGAASRWLGHCLRLGTFKHGWVSGTSYFLKLFSRLRRVGRDAPQTL